MGVCVCWTILKLSLMSFIHFQYITLWCCWMWVVCWCCWMWIVCWCCWMWVVCWCCWMWVVCWCCWMWVVCWCCWMWVVCWCCWMWVVCWCCWMWGCWCYWMWVCGLLFSGVAGYGLLFSGPYSPVGLISWVLPYITTVERRPYLSVPFTSCLPDSIPYSSQSASVKGIHGCQAPPVCSGQVSPESPLYWPCCGKSASYWPWWLTFMILTSVLD